MLTTFLANIPAPNIISFPGLGIGDFTLNPVAFRIPLPWTDGGSHPIMWYGIIIALAMIIGFSVALKKAKFEGIKSDDMFDLAIYLIIFAMLGARLYYVLMKPGDFNSLSDIIAVWNGGLAIYGGVIAGALTILIFSKIKKLKTAKLLDIAVPGLIIGQAIGRWGNFCNAEAHGTITDLPWRMGIADGYWIDFANGEAAFGNMYYFHPTFLYESLWNFLGFILIMSFYKRKKYDGQPTLWYFVWYGFGRFFIEGLRTDSLYLLESVLGKTVRVSQLVAALCVVGGAAALIIFGRRAKRRALDEGEYKEVYTAKRDALGIGEDSPAHETSESPENKDIAE